MFKVANLLAVVSLKLFFDLWLITAWRFFQSLKLWRIGCWCVLNAKSPRILCVSAPLRLIFPQSQIPLSSSIQYHFTFTSASSTAFNIGLIEISSPTAFFIHSFGVNRPLLNILSISFPKFLPLRSCSIWNSIK